VLYFTEAGALSTNNKKLKVNVILMDKKRTNIKYFEKN
jgi:hypothetical protein